MPFQVRVPAALSSTVNDASPPTTASRSRAGSAVRAQTPTVKRAEMASWAVKRRGERSAPEATVMVSSVMAPPSRLGLRLLHRRLGVRLRAADGGCVRADGLLARVLAARLPVDPPLVGVAVAELLGV